MDKDVFDVPDDLWKRIAPLVPRERPKPRGGRPRVPDRVAMAGILYRVRTGCQWKALPREFGSGSTCHLRMMQWVRAGVFVKIHAELLRHYDKRRGITWDFASLDRALAKAPKGGGATGPNPTDRAKLGVKRHVLTDGRGVPLSVLITGANVHDKWMVAKVLDAVVLRAPRGPRRPAHLCVDKGYDYADADAAVRRRGIIPHIRRRGEPPLLSCVRGKPRRWVVERTNSWHTTASGGCSCAGNELQPTTSRCSSSPVASSRINKLMGFRTCSYLIDNASWVIPGVEAAPARFRQQALAVCRMLEQVEAAGTPPGKSGGRQSLRQRRVLGVAPGAGRRPSHPGHRSELADLSRQRWASWRAPVGRVASPDRRPRGRPATLTRCNRIAR